MARIPAEVLRIYVPGRTLAEAYPNLARHLLRHDRLRGRAHRQPRATRLAAAGDRVGRASQARCPPDDQKKLLSRLTAVETLERFLHKAYLGQKRFSIEGLDVLVPMLDLTIELGGTAGARRVVIGMAHRGRLNVLAHIVGLPYETIFAEFEGGRHVEETLTPEGGTGDVKYHHGAEGAYRTAVGKTVTVTLSPQPEPPRGGESGGRGPGARGADEPPRHRTRTTIRRWRCRC